MRTNDDNMHVSEISALDSDILFLECQSPVSRYLHRCIYDPYYGCMVRPPIDRSIKPINTDNSI